jgi:hypothetical protein
LMLPQEPISKRDEDERRMVSFRLFEASPVMFFTDDIFVVVTRQTPIRRLQIEEGDVVHREEIRYN